MAVIETVFALCMFVNGSLDGHMITDGLSHCLKAKREGERNLSDSRENVIRYQCGQVEAELVIPEVVEKDTLHWNAFCQNQPTRIIASRSLL